MIHTTRNPIGDRQAMQFFVTNTIQQTTKLPLGLAVANLQGILAIAGDHPEINPLKAIYNELSDSYYCVGEILEGHEENLEVAWNSL